MDALWPSERELALLTDLYELTMAQAYWRDDHRGEAVFSLFFRKLPAGRRFAVACGQEYAAHLIRGLRFHPEQIERAEHFAERKVAAHDRDCRLHQQCEPDDHRREST